MIQAFTNALQKGMDFVQAHTPEEIASVIAPQFPETDLKTITAIVNRYYAQDTWKADLIFEKESFELLQDILESAGELDSRAPYEKLVTTEFAKKLWNKSFLAEENASTIIKRKPDFWLPFFKNTRTKQITFFERTLYYYD